MKARKSLPTTIAVIASHAQGEAGIHGRRIRCGKIRDIEPEDLTYLDALMEERLYWQYGGRWQPSQWRAETKPVIRRETERLTPFLRSGYTYVHATFGVSAGKYDGPDMRAWLKAKITKLNRLNASKLFKQYGVRLELSGSHIDIHAGSGLVRPMRPHWHLLLRFKKGEDRQALHATINLILEHIRVLVGCMVTTKRPREHSRAVCLVNDRDYLANTIAYILAYPIQLLDPNRLDKDGLHVGLPLHKGLRLQPKPKPSSQSPPLPPGLPPPPPPPPKDGLTHALALSPAIDALAGAHTYRTYGKKRKRAKPLEGTLCVSCDGTEPVAGADGAKNTSPEALPGSDTEGDLRKNGSRRGKAQMTARSGPNTIIAVWQKEHPTIGWMTCVKVKHFTNRPELEAALQRQGRGWVVASWIKERAKLRAIQAGALVGTGARYALP